jgi:hypothetical protein
MNIIWHNGDLTMTPDEYVKQVLQKYAIPYSKSLQYNQIGSSLRNPISEWACGYMLELYWSGSYSKGTAINITTDIDLFISMDHNTPGTLKNMFDTLFNKFNGLGYNPRKQNVSIGMMVNGVAVDLIPGRKLSGNTNDHNLWKHKQQTTIKTNVNQHINLVKNSGRVDEIKLIKIWRELNNIEFPSIYLELAVIEALKGNRIGDLANNVIAVLNFLSSQEFRDKSFVDPANSANIISNDITPTEKSVISTCALSSKNKSCWGDIVW